MSPTFPPLQDHVTRLITTDAARTKLRCSCGIKTRPCPDIVVAYEALAELHEKRAA